MLLIPAIDIKGGKCVRLLQGDPDRETVYSDDPAAMARRFESLGARLIHVVDLDGAFEGRPVNAAIVRKIAGAVSVPIEIGGGIRDEKTVEKYLEAGIKRIILGTAVLGDKKEALISRFAPNLIMGVDARNSMVATHGWKQVTGVRAVDFIRELASLGLKEVIYTDISTDGMLTGPNYGAFETLLKEVPGLNLIASGGVSVMEDLERLSELAPGALKGCIVGKAIYDGRIDLEKALARFSS